MRTVQLITLLVSIWSTKVNSQAQSSTATPGGGAVTETVIPMEAPAASPVAHAAASITVPPGAASGGVLPSTTMGLPHAPPGIVPDNTPIPQSTDSAVSTSGNTESPLLPNPASTDAPGSTEATSEASAIPGSTEATSEASAIPGSTEATSEASAIPGSAAATSETSAVPGSAAATSETSAVPGSTAATSETSAVPGSTAATSAAPVSGTTSAAPVSGTTSAAPVSGTTSAAPVSGTTSAAPVPTASSSTSPKNCKGLFGEEILNGQTITYFLQFEAFECRDGALKKLSPSPWQPMTCKRSFLNFFGVGANDGWRCIFGLWSFVPPSTCYGRLGEMVLNGQNITYYPEGKVYHCEGGVFTFVEKVQISRGYCLAGDVVIPNGMTHGNLKCMGGIVVINADKAPEPNCCGSFCWHLWSSWEYRSAWNHFYFNQWKVERSSSKHVTFSISRGGKTFKFDPASNQIIWGGGRRTTVPAPVLMDTEMRMISFNLDGKVKAHHLNGTLIPGEYKFNSTLIVVPPPRGPI